MSKRIFHPSELILNDDGSIYHLALRPEHVADTVMIVGDQDRVQKISKYFDRIDFKIQNREFRTHTGIYRNVPISVISTGIGTDNIDIFVNELDAVVNIDLQTKKLKPVRRSLDIIRIGTTGALHSDIPVGGHILSKFALGLEGLLHFYNYSYSPEEQELNKQINEHLDWDPKLPTPYIVKGSDSLISRLEEGMISGITATAPGFYAPQGRSLVLKPRVEDIYEKLHSFFYNGMRINNFEMETSALYGLGALLGHHCCTCCVVLANRATGAFASDHHEVVEKLILKVLDKITEKP